MRVALITAGAGQMYCGSCLQGNTLATALCAAGVEAVLVPLYTPVRTDEPSAAGGPVAFGGINVYLQQRWSLFRHTPWLFDRLLDRPGLLRLAARRSAGVRPEHLGSLTLSVLQGEEGRQRKELEKLVRWLGGSLRPEIVHLSNVLLAGVARQIRSRLRVPVVATLSGEDLFLDGLTEPYRQQSWDVLRQRVADLDGLAAMNHYYAELMAQRLDIPRGRVQVIPPGLNLAGYAKKDDARSQPQVPAPEREIVVGYLARVCPEKGLHLLAEALILLAADAALPRVRVQAAGYLDRAERPYLDAIERRLRQAGLGDRFEYVGEPSRAEKIAFLESLDLFCLPTVYSESKGLPVLEAWACGTPAVLPRHGTFPELVEDTGGAMLHEPGNPEALADAIRELVRNPVLAAECGRRARTAVHQRYDARRMAEQTMAWYAGVKRGA